MNSRGQIVVEYVLLLTISVSLAIFIITALVKRDPDDINESGAIIQRWEAILREIGNDTP